MEFFLNIFQIFLREPLLQRDTEDCWNCCCSNTASTSKLGAKVQKLSPGKVKVPMAAVKEEMEKLQKENCRAPRAGWIRE